MKNEKAVVEVAGYEKALGICGRLMDEGIAFLVEPINSVDRTNQTDDHFYDFKCLIVVRSQDAKTLTMICKESGE